MNVDRGKLAESGHGIAALLPFSRNARDVSVPVLYQSGGKSWEWTGRAKAGLDVMPGCSLDS